MQSATTDPKVRRLNLVRYGLMVIPIVAWMVAFAPPFLFSKGVGMDWISDALIPSLVTAAVVGVVCALVYFAYKRFVLKI